MEMFGGPRLGKGREPYESRKESAAHLEDSFYVHEGERITSYCIDFRKALDKIGKKKSRG